MSKDKKPILELSPAMRANLKLKILRKAKENPEFEKELMKRMESKNQNQYLNEYHKETTEKKLQAIAESKASELDLNKEVKHQKEFKEKAKEMEESQYKNSKNNKI